VVGAWDLSSHGGETLIFNLNASAVRLIYKNFNLMNIPGFMLCRCYPRLIHLCESIFHVSAVYEVLSIAAYPTIQQLPSALPAEGTTCYISNSVAGEFKMTGTANTVNSRVSAGLEDLC